MSHYNKDFVFVNKFDHNIISYESNIAINRGISASTYPKLPYCSMNDGCVLERHDVNAPPTEGRPHLTWRQASTNVNMVTVT